MKLTNHIIGINTDQGAAARDFYVKHFGFQVVHDNGVYIQLRHADTGAEIAFMQPAHESQPAAFQPAYKGGAWLALEVDDVDAEYDRLKSALPIEVDIRNEPWGERHFAVIDPAGVVVNVMKMMECAAQTGSSN